MEAVSEILEDISENEGITVNDRASQVSQKIFNGSHLSKLSYKPSVIGEAKTAGLLVKLKSVKKSNKIRRQILEKEMQLAELNIQMEIERAKAPAGYFIKIRSRYTPTLDTNRSKIPAERSIPDIL